ncbi:hypothetical protein KUF71_005003 [Frankliniella fusca]|uniref:Uncharacterized protein n=1 Tax=Frankliniella fusca TaxID=407009 RepID=A0AAE1HZ47_9NEOP|nr:hypothetical protein KUF71_005003 [Frankliniella fusca]
MAGEDGSNPLAYRPLSEDVLHIKILAEKFQQVRAELVASLAQERSRSRALEQRAEQAVHADRLAAQAAQRAVTLAKDYALLDKIASRLREDNVRLKAEIQELKDRTSVEASMAAARCAALERSAKEAQRAVEKERQTAREQAREAREAAEKEKKIMQDEFKKKAEETRLAHEEEIAALRDEIKSVREECAEEVNVTALEFEDRNAQLSERIAALEAESRALQEQLSASCGHIEYLESRMSEQHFAHEAERNRLLEVNRSLMLQQQSLLLASSSTRLAQPRPARPGRAPPLSVAASSRARLGLQHGLQHGLQQGLQQGSQHGLQHQGSQPASVLPYPQLSMARRLCGGAAAGAQSAAQQTEQPGDAAPQLPPQQPPSSPPPPAPRRRGARKLFDSDVMNPTTLAERNSGRAPIGRLFAPPSPPPATRPTPTSCAPPCPSNMRTVSVPQSASPPAVPAAALTFTPSSAAAVSTSLTGPCAVPSPAAAAAFPSSTHGRRFTFKKRVFGSFTARGEPPPAPTAPAAEVETPVIVVDDSPPPPQSGRAREHHADLSTPAAAAGPGPQRESLLQLSQRSTCESLLFSPPTPSASQAPADKSDSPPIDPSSKKTAAASTMADVCPSAGPSSTVAAASSKQQPSALMKYLSKLPASKLRWSIPPQLAEPPPRAAAAAPTNPPPSGPQAGHEQSDSSLEDTRQFFRSLQEQQRELDSLRERQSSRAAGPAEAAPGCSAPDPPPATTGEPQADVNPRDSAVLHQQESNNASAAALPDEQHSVDETTTAALPDLQTPLVTQAAALPDPQTPLVTPAAALPDPQTPLVTPAAALPDLQTPLVTPAAALSDPQTPLVTPAAALPDPQTPLVTPAAALPDLQTPLVTPAAALPDPQTPLVTPAAALPDLQTPLVTPAAALPDLQTPLVPPAAAALPSLESAEHRASPAVSLDQPGLLLGPASTSGAPAEQPVHNPPPADDSERAMNQPDEPEPAQDDQSEPPASPESSDIFGSMDGESFDVSSSFDTTLATSRLGSPFSGAEPAAESRQDDATGYSATARVSDETTESETTCRPVIPNSRETLTSVTTTPPVDVHEPGPRPPSGDRADDSPAQCETITIAPSQDQGRRSSPNERDSTLSSQVHSPGRAVGVLLTNPSSFHDEGDQTRDFPTTLASVTGIVEDDGSSSVTTVLVVAPPPPTAAAEQPDTDSTLRARPAAQLTDPDQPTDRHRQQLTVAVAVSPPGQPGPGPTTDDARVTRKASTPLMCSPPEEETVRDPLEQSEAAAAAARLLCRRPDDLLLQPLIASPDCSDAAGAGTAAAATVRASFSCFSQACAGGAASQTVEVRLEHRVSPGVQHAAVTSSSDDGSISYSPLSSEPDEVEKAVVEETLEAVVGRASSLQKVPDPRPPPLGADLKEQHVPEGDDGHVVPPDSALTGVDGKACAGEGLKFLQDAYEIGCSQRNCSSTASTPLKTPLGSGGVLKRRCSASPGAATPPGASDAPEPSEQPAVPTPMRPKEARGHLKRRQHQCVVTAGEAWRGVAARDTAQPSPATAQPPARPAAWSGYPTPPLLLLRVAYSTRSYNETLHGHGPSMREAVVRITLLQAFALASRSIS